MFCQYLTFKYSWSCLGVQAGLFLKIDFSWAHEIYVAIKEINQSDADCTSACLDVFEVLQLNQRKTTTWDRGLGAFVHLGFTAPSWFFLTPRSCFNFIVVMWIYMVRNAQTDSSEITISPVDQLRPSNCAWEQLFLSNSRQQHLALNYSQRR